MTRNNHVIEIFPPFSTFAVRRFNTKFLLAFVNEASTCLEFFNHSATFIHGKLRTIFVVFHILSMVKSKKKKKNKQTNKQKRKMDDKANYVWLSTSRRLSLSAPENHSRPVTVSFNC